MLPEGLPSAQSRLSAYSPLAGVMVAGRRRCPRAPAHARGEPPSSTTLSRVITARAWHAWGATAERYWACARGHPHRPAAPKVARHVFAHLLIISARGRWLGARAQAPFAVSSTFGRELR